MIENYSYFGVPCSIYKVLFIFWRRFDSAKFFLKPLRRCFFISICPEPRIPFKYSEPDRGNILTSTPPCNAILSFWQLSSYKLVYFKCLPVILIRNFPYDSYLSKPALILYIFLFLVILVISSVYFFFIWAYFIRSFEMVWFFSSIDCFKNIF